MQWREAAGVVSARACRWNRRRFAAPAFSRRQSNARQVSVLDEFSRQKAAVTIQPVFDETLSSAG